MYVCVCVCVCVCVVLFVLWECMGIFQNRCYYFSKSYSGTFQTFIGLCKYKTAKFQSNINSKWGYLVYNLPKSFFSNWTLTALLGKKFAYLFLEHLKWVQAKWIKVSTRKKVNSSYCCSLCLWFLPSSCHSIHTHVFVILSLKKYSYLLLDFHNIFVMYRWLQMVTV
jgi:hypothetical protein